MADLLILYNPYYQNNVIEAHLELLKTQGQVAFGKVRSKLKDEFEANSQANWGGECKFASKIKHNKHKFTRKFK